MLNRRSIVAAAIFGFFLGTLLLASRRLGDLCADDDSSCLNLADIQSALPFQRKGSQKPLPEDEKEDEHTEEQTEEPATLPDTAANFRKLDPACAAFPDTSNVLVVMKTGASEAYSKIPTQILTNLRCVYDFLFFSDMAETIAGYEVHDSLDTVLDDVKVSNDDFELYFQQQKCAVDRDSCNKGHDVASQGWALDKYKNIHIAEKTYRLRPSNDWYLFVDADSYVVWSTMAQWLKRLDPTEPHYLGSMAFYGDIPFGHGGSGYLVSRAAMQGLFDGKENVANNWDEATIESCCGDVMFAQALKNETGLSVNNTWPTINGEKPYTLAYGPNQWCNPIATMHHIGSEEVSMFEAFEQEHGFTTPMRIKDIYHRFVASKLEQHHRLDWDNMSEEVLYMDVSEEGGHEDWQISMAKTNDLSEVEAVAHHSFDDCRRACQEDDQCFQYAYRHEICALGHAFALGGPKPAEEGRDQWMSGWITDRIQAWVEENDECGEIVWPTD